jgi:hypothetical protein
VALTPGGVRVAERHEAVQDRSAEPLAPAHPRASCGFAARTIKSSGPPSAWADYLGDPPLAAAFLDRLVDGSVILKLTGRSYRAHRARRAPEAGQAGRT